MNTTYSNDAISSWTSDQLLSLGVPEQAAMYINLFALITGAAILIYLADFLARKIFVGTAHKFAAKSSTRLVEFMARNRVVVYLARIVPLIIVVQAIPIVFADFPTWIPALNKFTDIYLILLWMWVARAVLRTCKDFLKTTETFKEKPIESFLQVITIFLYFIVGLLIFSTLTGKDAWAFITAMGAASAILMLIFKDTIMGFVASIQVSSNDMVRIGDWVTMDKYGADGEVTEINLTTVKVQNFDKTITTIPTYYLISDSFKNWRGMQTSGGRRIKRSVYIKISSIRYLSADEVAELSKIQLLKSYLEERQNEISRFNKENEIDKSLLINGRSLTNVGVFRKYIDAYIKQHPGTHKEMIMMVRQLEPTTTGMPIELYLFANSIVWVEYEGIMADIFDHLLAAVKYFDLEVFEMPAADDVRSLHFNAAGTAGVRYPMAETMQN
ncbi:mechanosensitive ion channel family protein [Pontibacter sp. HSC-36F09]|uniref:mechanosensitive ion channel family protein n=1 Tax=Pontibacter sp. HSC-36F09 TaxID=2910966 RepID=UPI0020A19F8D|nr:mechanosensitive ion channel domain-containing protein [Pontibacter sp. HSC-36F09]MCP2042811.1 miniconductance mechanosensitive channel [Pontibacter sp. HSC-36F09]